MTIQELLLYDPSGNLVTPVFQFSRFEWARAENKIGTATLSLPYSSVDRFLVKDARLELWRTVGSRRYLEGNTQWFLRKIVYGSKRSNVGIELTFFDANYILAAAEIEYAASSSYTSKTAAIDNMMKAIARENIGSSATDALRNLAAYISIQADLGLAPSTSKAFARRNMLAVLYDLAAESNQRGTYLCFDLQRLSSSMLEFRTFIGQLGTDRGTASLQQVIVNEDKGNLVNPQMTIDYSNEITCATAGGTGQDAERVVTTVVDPIRSIESPFSRRELFVEATQCGTDTTLLENEARAALMNARPLRTLTGILQSTNNIRYGLDYNFGDIVVGEHNGFTFNCHIDTVHGMVSGSGKEVIECRIRGSI